MDIITGNFVLGSDGSRKIRHGNLLHTFVAGSGGGGSGGSPSAGSLLDNLISYWPLDEAVGATEAADAKGRFPLTPNGSKLVSGFGGVIDRCWGRTAAESDAIRASTSLPSAEYAGGFSMNLWIKAPADGSLYGNAPLMMIAKYNNGSSEDRSCPGLYQSYDGADTIYYTFAPYNIPSASFDSTVVALGLSKDNNWHMLTGTYIPGEAKMYLDGELKDTKDINQISTLSGYPTIGGTAWNHSNSLLFDEAGLWGRVLTAAEVGKLYNNGAGLSLKSAIEGAGA